MRFVAKYRNYEFVAIPTRTPEKAVPYGLQAEQPVVCKFQHGGLSEWEKQEALKVFEFKLGHDETAWKRLSFYDTDLEAVRLGWPDEIKERVEARLLAGVGYGTDYIMVEKPRLEPPWPTYDQLRKPSEIVQVVKTTGIDPALVIAYEMENEGRESVIHAFETKEPEPEPLVQA